MDLAHCLLVKSSLKNGIHCQAEVLLSVVFSDLKNPKLLLRSPFSTVGQISTEVYYTKFSILTLQEKKKFPEVTVYIK